MRSQLCLDLDDARPTPVWTEILSELHVTYEPHAPQVTTRLETPESIVTQLRAFARYRPDQEKFWAIPLDNRCRARGIYLVTLGTLTTTLASPREAFRIAVATSAASLVVAHNHPSGDPAPSAADIAMTRRLRESGAVLDIPLQDHIVLGSPSFDPLGIGYYSFRQAGLL